jgi:hypothetical protein
LLLGKWNLATLNRRQIKLEPSLVWRNNACLRTVSESADFGGVVHSQQTGLHVELDAEIAC